MQWKNLIFALLIALVIPYLMFCIAESCLPKTVVKTEPAPTAEATVPQESTVRVLQGEQVMELPLEEYIIGVLLGEMPTDFHLEALKAQAVAVRTYTLKNQKHPLADVCTDSSCCQAYCAPGEYSSQEQETVRQAVNATQDQVLTYGGQLIDATYFSCSGGRTEDALAVWGADIPYLQSVESPGEEQAAHFVDTLQFTASEFAALLGVQLGGMPSAWFGETVHTRGGGVETMVIGGVSYSGIQLRQLLGLRSTAFTLTAVGDTITVTTKGFGHRVGMSQYGADAMANAGSDYRQILTHYYPGTSIDKIGDL